MAQFVVGLTNIVWWWTAPGLCAFLVRTSLSLVCALEFLSSAKGSGGLVVLCNCPILEFYCFCGV
jgi:hypothetical protein